MGVSGELVVAVQAADVEAVDDLADPVALLAASMPLSASNPVPLTYSLTSTRSRENEVTTPGTTMNG